MIYIYEVRTGNAVINMMQKRRIEQVKSRQVNAYVIVNLVHSMQYILIEYLVHSTQVCDFEQSYSACENKMSSVAQEVQGYLGLETNF